MLAVKAGEVCAIQPFPNRFLANLSLSLFLAQEVEKWWALVLTS